MVYMVNPTLHVDKTFKDQVEDSQKKISFKYTVWYKQFNEDGKYVCYCTSNVLWEYENESNDSV